MALVHPGYEPHGPYATTARLTCQSRTVGASEVIGGGGGVRVRSIVCRAPSSACSQDTCSISIPFAISHSSFLLQC
eukprot:365627-Prymnesium_polylepis.1